MKKVLSIAVVVVSFFVFALAPQVHADTFVSLDSQTTLRNNVFQSRSCVTLQDKTSCYDNVGSLHVQTIDDNINIGLDNYFIYE
jgi:hypothetical protein